MGLFDFFKRKKPEKKQVKPKPKKKVVKKKTKPERKIKERVLDEDKGFFRYKELNPDEISYLIKQGYKIAKYNSLNLKRKEKYLLRPRHNESLSHLFYTYDIAEYLKKYTDKIELFETTKPDIVFKINGKKMAIEVETGKLLVHAKKQVLHKVDLLNKFYDDWFFVMTNKKFIPKYRKLGKVIDLRYFKSQLERFIKKCEN